MAEQEYQRLTRSSGRTALGFISLNRGSLWLGKDHLLCVETTGYAESYKRFYFRDIQAFSISRTSMRMALSIIFAVIAALFLLIGFTADDNTARIVFVCLAVLMCLVPLPINLARGPTCCCQVRTAVQTEDLPIRRVRAAQRILERIRPLIATAQGHLTVEEIAFRMQQIAAPGTVGPDPAPASFAAAAPQAMDDPNLPPRIAS